MTMHRYYFVVLVTIAVSSSAQRNLSEPIIRNPSRTSYCPSSEMRETIRDDIEDGVRDQLLIYNYDNQPPCSCGGIIPWRRIAYLNMSDHNQQCPTGWTLFTLNNEPLRGCIRSTGGCVGVRYPSPRGKAYSRVCGRITATMKGGGSAFLSYVGNNRLTLEDNYLSGISVTHGAVGSRQHIWSFVSSLFDNYASRGYLEQRCECSVANFPYSSPPFVGDNYFCSTARPSRAVSTWYPDNPMFDGEGCPSHSPACCSFHNPPWFCTTLPQSTTDDLEIRNCHHHLPSSAGLAISLIDIYVS